MGEIRAVRRIGMWIRELHITAFGKLQNVDIQLDRGFNIIKGGNEAGKSTLHAFILAMFFGASRARGRASKDEIYSRYKPRSTPGSFGGSMVFEHDGVVYRLERVFLNSEKSCRLTSEDTGKEIELADGSITSLIPELAESSYKNTMSVMSRQTEPDPSVKGSVMSRIAGLGEGGDAGIDVFAALKDLGKRRKETGAGRAGQHLAAIEDELARQESISKKIGEISARLDELEAESREIDAGLKEEERITELEGAEGPEGAENIEKTERLAGSGIAEGCEGRENSENPDKVTRRDGKGKNLKDRLYLASVVTMMPGIVLLLLFNERSALGVGLGVAALAASVVLFAAAVILGKAQQKEKETDPGETEAEKLKIRYRELSQRRMELLERSEQIKREMMPLYGEFSVLSEKEQSVDLLKKERDEAAKELEAARLEDEALRIAMDEITGLSQSMHTHFDRLLSEKLTEYVRAFTAGKHERAVVDDNLKIGVKDGESTVAPYELSTGAADQTELAFRLAVADLFFKGKNVPLILDEVFESFDDERLASTLDVILENFDNQVICFTCHDREEKLLGEAGHVIEL